MTPEMPSRRAFLRQACTFAGLTVTGLGCTPFPRGARALRSGVAYLCGRQSADGAWRSTQYAAFRDGDALTPLVLRVLAASNLPEAAPSVAKGRRWLEQCTDALEAEPEPWRMLRYPLFTAADSACVFAGVGDAARMAFWVRMVEKLRIEKELGWAARGSMCGAWSDSPTPPCLPPGTEAIADMLAPNVSATFLGVDALAAARQEDQARRALPFLFECQNFSDSRDEAFDDGGFFFALEDPIRNKAGRAGVESSGMTRFCSYGSATCDGLLAMRRCGLDLENPRVDAAMTWLRRHARGAQHAGDWPAERAEARESLVFYYCRAFAEVLAWASGNPRYRPWARVQREILVRDLMNRQASDGSWQGSAGDSCEDDPLLATALAIRSLASS